MHSKVDTTTGYQQSPHQSYTQAYIIRILKNIKKMFTIIAYAMKEDTNKLTEFTALQQDYNFLP